MDHLLSTAAHNTTLVSGRVLESYYIVFWAEASLGVLSTASFVFLVSFIAFVEIPARGKALSLKAFFTPLNSWLFVLNCSVAGVFGCIAWFHGLNETSQLSFQVGSIFLASMEMSYTAYSWVRAKDIFKLHVTLSTYRNVQKLIYVLPFICMAIIACTFIDLTSNVLKQYLFLLLVCLAGIIALTLDLFFALGYIRQLLQNQDNNVHIPLHYSIISRYGLLTTLLSFLSLVFCIIQFLVHSRLVQSTVSSPPPDILIEAYTLTVILQDLFVFLSFFTLLMMRVALLRPSVHGVFGRRTSSSLAKNYLQSGSNDTRGVGSSGDSVRKGSGAIQQNFLSSVSVFMTQQQQQQQQQSFSRTNLGIFRTPSLSMGAGGATVSKGLKSRASSMSFPKS